MKRARTSGGSVTGGTGDVKPQIMTISTPANTPGQYIVATRSLPVPRFGSMKTKATIFELLKIWWHPAYLDILAGADILVSYLTTSTFRSTGDNVNSASMSADAADSRTFGMVLHQSYEHITEVGDGHSAALANRNFPLHVDLTDGNGNGILIATDNITLVCGNDTGSAAAQWTAKILYRLVNVGITEYVGIVQSQQ